MNEILGKIITGDPLSSQEQKKLDAASLRYRFARYPVRTCRTLHFCEVCKCNITMGQTYFDGGYGRRAHCACVPSIQEEMRK